MKTFYVISALVHASSQLGNLKRLDTEKEAIEHARTVIGRRRQEGKPEMDFHILKVVAIVGTEKPAIKVQRARK